jgi:predicted DNA-binding protein (MmcQ/YjbR family)
LNTSWVDRVLALGDDLPDVTPGTTVHHPALHLRGKGFVICAGVDSGQPSLWVKSTAETQRTLVDYDPERFFVPPYLGSRGGWVGVLLLDDTDWAEVAELVEDAYRLVAGKRRIALLEELRRSSPP